MDLQVGDFCSINRDARFELMKNFSDVVLQVSLYLINLLPSLITSLCERKLAHSSNQKGKNRPSLAFLAFHHGVFSGQFSTMALLFYCIRNRLLLPYVQMLAALS